MQEEAPLADDEARHLEQVAEAALLTLGPRLEWKRMGGSAFYQYADAVADGSIRYLVSFSREVAKWRVAHCVNFRRPKRTDERPLFDDIADAKAACERHYATGQWESNGTT